jgi:DNA-binding transcriptional regulator/RsmH inhibitor MraZ
MAEVKDPVAPHDVEAEPAFFGQHYRNIDGGRIIIPPEWRSRAPVTSFFMSLWPIATREFVAVVPPRRWAAYLRNLDAQVMAADQASDIKRRLGMHAMERPIDAYGRLLLSEAAITLLGPGKEVCLIGCVETFEIWPLDKLKKSSEKPLKQETFEILNRIRL